MARYNEILVGRYNRYFQKLFGMKGAPPAPQLASEVTTALPLFTGAENRYLEGWQRFGLGIRSSLPAAGNRAAWRIRNPSGSNLIAVIERLDVTPFSLTDTINLFYNAIATTLPTENQSNLTGIGTDFRGVTNSTCIISTSINFGLVGTGPIWLGQTAVNTVASYVLTDIQELVMAPGSQYTYVPTSLVNEVEVNCFWRERSLEESEVK
jgi:hypothetical protein